MRGIKLVQLGSLAEWRNATREVICDSRPLVAYCDLNIQGLYPLKLIAPEGHHLCWLRGYRSFVQYSLLARNLTDDMSREVEREFIRRGVRAERGMPASDLRMSSSEIEYLVPDIEASIEYFGDQESLFGDRCVSRKFAGSLSDLVPGTREYALFRIFDMSCRDLSEDCFRDISEEECIEMYWMGPFLAIVVGLTGVPIEGALFGAPSEESVRFEISRVSRQLNFIERVMWPSFFDPLSQALHVCTSRLHSKEGTYSLGQMEIYRTVHERGPSILSAISEKYPVLVRSFA